MTYRKPGHYELPAGLLVPQWCSKIKVGDAWERDLAATLDSLGRGGRRVSTIGLEDVVAMEGKGLFAPGLPASRALQHVLLRLLHALGITDRYPAVIGYTSSPYLTIDECLDSMLTAYIRWPTLDSLGGAAAFNLEAFKAVLPTIIRELSFQGVLRDVMISRLRRKLGAIAFKLATGQAIDQAERSFFVAFGNPDEENALTRPEKDSGGKTVAGIIAAEDADPLVSETWELYKASTEQGPYLRFVTVKSNTNLENLVYWYGPQQAALVYGLGYSFPYGKHFVEPRVKEGISLPWSASDQLAAARERNVAFKFDDTKAIMRNPILATVDGATAPDPTWDMPEVNIRVRLEDKRVVVTEYSYYSTWRERIVSTIHGANPQTLLNDIALMKESIGEALSSGKSIQDWNLIDMELSAAHLKDRAPTLPSYEEQIVLPKIDATGGVRVVPLDLTDFYKRYGTTMFLPAFKEFVMAPMAWLYVEDAEAEAFIAARLGLTWEEKEQAIRSIRISHNFSKLRRLLSEGQLPITEGKMVALCGAIMGR